ncbi:beta-glucoside-specific PTS transporter subunit IIABC [Listeria kieliensis]|uniref:PTS sucrose transporter subunit IIBC n=1 Tax=Listeria kieliensis TaxID=1621700 RepID=A0A3D8TRA4_9LIST|nr:beta-glucoside-specific PTS transporter subunit IIABC [Listeria kieliensis]RDX01207.1 PTS sucrose transporter subunit IIBC [Listeria kieliensis]
MEKDLGKKILQLVGGEANISAITHCATRLRMSFQDKKKVNEAGIKQLDGVLGTMEKGGQYQVIIGPAVDQVYQDLIHATRFESGIKEEGTKGKKNIITLFLDTVAGIFTPLLPLLAGSGVLRGIVLLLTQVGWLSEESSTYVILTAASTAVFYFLPILLAFTAAKKFGANPFVAVAVMGALIMPDFTALMGSKGNGAITHFIGIPIVLMNYTSTVIPAILAIWCQSKLEKGLKKIIPTSMQLLFVSLITLLIMVPLTAAIFGPFGVYVGEALAKFINALMSTNGWIAGAFIGGVWNIMVIFGLQWAVNPIMIQNISVLGYDKIVPLSAAANFGMAGAALGTLIKTKDKKMKSFSVSALLSIFFAGITEPAIYGIAVRYKKPLIAAVLGGAIGGAFIGGMSVNAYAFVFGGLTTLPAFVGKTFVYYVIGLLICFVVGTVATLILGLGEDEQKPEATENKTSPQNREENIEPPLVGEVIQLAEVKDPVFSQETLGKGFAIVPTKGEVRAPFDGVVSMVFKTKHAIGLKSDNGTELLIHVGLDTVQLNGEYFETTVKEGDRVKTGDMLLTFNLAKLQEKGYDVTTPVVVTNSAQKEIHLKAETDLPVEFA